MTLTKEKLNVLRSVSTATITTVLLKKGLRNIWMRGVLPLRKGEERIAGPAFTLRFIPAREDLATPESWSSPISTRAAIEAMPEGCIAVVDAMGITAAGIFGDILCARMQKRQVAALVTDGAVRDLEGVLRTNLPVWCQSVAAPPSVASLTFVAWQQPVGCGGVAVFPDDAIVLDGAAAVEKAAADAGTPIKVEVSTGRGDATQEQTDVESVGYLNPRMDGFRNYLGKGSALPTEFALVDRANLLGLSAPQLTVLLGGLRVLGANHGGSDAGVFTDRVGVLTNDFFVNLLELGTTWVADDASEETFTGTTESGATRKATRNDLVFGSNSELRAVAEVYASDDAREKFVKDFAAAWAKVMDADRWDLR